MRELADVYAAKGDDYAANEWYERGKTGPERRERGKSRSPQKSNLSKGELLGPKWDRRSISVVVNGDRMDGKTSLLERGTAQTSSSISIADPKALASRSGHRLFETPEANSHQPISSKRSLASRSATYTPKEYSDSTAERSGIAISQQQHQLSEYIYSQQGAVANNNALGRCGRCITQGLSHISTSPPYEPGVFDRMGICNQQRPSFRAMGPPKNTQYTSQNILSTDVRTLSGNQIQDYRM